MSKASTKHIIKNSVIFAMLLITIAAWIPAVIASMKEFYAGMSFPGTSYVGLDNYTKLLNEDMPWLVLKNSLVSSLLTAFFGGVLVAIFTFIIRKLPKWLGVTLLSVIALSSGLCLTIILVYPGVFEVIAEPIYQMILVYTGYEAVSWLPFWLVFAVAYAKNNDNKSIFKLIITFALIRIMMLFSMGSRELAFIENPMNKEFIETLDVWMFHNYRAAGDYCNTMAMSVIALICSLPLALVFAIVVHKMFKLKIGFFRCLMYALIIVLNQEVIMHFFVCMINDFFPWEGLLFDALRTIPYIAMAMLIWEIGATFRETIIPATIIFAVRGILTYCMYKNVYMGIVAGRFYTEIQNIEQDPLTSIDLEALTCTAYGVGCIGLGILCMISIWVSALINRKK